MRKSCVYLFFSVTVNEIRERALNMDKSLFINNYSTKYTVQDLEIFPP